MRIDFGFNPFFDQDIMDEYILEVKIGNQIEKQHIMGDENSMKMQFMAFIKEIGRQNQPIRLRIIRVDKIWDQYNNIEKTLENYLQFANKTYMETFPTEF